MTLASLNFPTQLAGNPKQKLKYAITTQMRSGDDLELADPKATRAMVALMDMEAVIGGAASHYGGPAAFAELMSAAHGLAFYLSEKEGKQWHECFHLINDAGHCENGLYALKANYGYDDMSVETLRGFRSLQSSLTGHGEAHLFPTGVYLSNGPLGSALPQSQGLAMGDRLAGKDRVTLTAISDGACMEGEAREALASIPGLAAKGQLAPYVLIISDNNTKLSGRIDSDSFSMTPSFEALATLGWDVIKLEDGHNLNSCLQTLEEAIDRAKKKPETPIAIHAKTIKGIGTKKTAESSSGGHGFPLKSASDMESFLREIYGDHPLPETFLTWAKDLIAKQEKKNAQKKTSSNVPNEKIQLGISAAMISRAQKGLPVISVTSDLPGSTGVAGFRKEFPNHSFDVGIAESNMVSAAAGLSKQGYIPVVDTFAQFGVTKGALPLVMASLSQAPVIAVFSHVGFQDAADGASHQALSYFAMTSSIPHANVYSLSCSSEAEALMGQTIDQFQKMRSEGKVPPTTIFFLGRENFPRHYQESANYELGKIPTCFDNTKEKKPVATILAAGSVLPQALEAARILSEKNYGTVVLHNSTINQPDLETLKETLNKTQGNLLTVEDHQWVGGMGAIVSHQLCQEKVSFQLESLGVKNQFGQSAYVSQDLYDKHGLDGTTIAKTIEKSFL